MVDKFTFGGINSDDFHMYISGYGTYGTSERDVTIQSIPGRNGDLTIDNGRFTNIGVIYKAVIYDNLAENYKAFSSQISKLKGYQRLEDTFHPDEFRLGIFRGGLKPKLRGYNGAGLELTFNCKPQKYLKSGEEVFEINQEGLLNNPTDFDANPLIKLYGSGTLTINSTSLVVTNVAANDYIMIDSELMNAYKGSTNLNSKISGPFPKLVPGDNEITYTGALEIEPRWFYI